MEILGASEQNQGTHPANYHIKQNPASIGRRANAVGVTIAVIFTTSNLRARVVDMLDLLDWFTLCLVFFVRLCIAIGVMPAFIGIAYSKRPSAWALECTLLLATIISPRRNEI